MNSDEHILLRKLREGDTEALDILYLRYAAKVRDFAFRLLGDSVEAEDITHDIFLKVCLPFVPIGMPPGPGMILE